MKLTIIGGGGFRVPQIFEALINANTTVTQLCLHDVAPERLKTIRGVLMQLDTGFNKQPRVTSTTDLDDAVRGADVVFSAMRIGGTDGRIVDERVALRLGVLGQETVGPGGLAFAFRTLPQARRLAHRIAALAPDAWVINFTNPAGMVTEAMRQVLGDRVIGICDTPIGLLKRTLRAIGTNPSEGTAGGVGSGRVDPGRVDPDGVDPDGVDFDYVGLNHLGWLRRVSVAGEDRLPALLADDVALGSIEEARLMGFDWVRAIGAIPNEYLYYYYFRREAIERIRSSAETRGEFLKRQQSRFYDEALMQPERALELWNRAKHQRESSYMAESRPEQDRDNRAESDIEGGGYQTVALELMRALAGTRPATMILNVANGQTVPELPAEAVIEVPCTVDAGVVTAHRIAPVAGEMLGLLQQVKAAEQLAIVASATRDPGVAWRALAAHPLVDSVAVAKMLLDGYRHEIPAVGAAFD